MSNAYNDIKEDLSQMSRRDQYHRLLQTEEWLDFRRENLKLDNKCCTNCKTEEGPIFIQTMTDEELIQHRVQVGRNEAELKKWKKDNVDLFMKFLLDEVKEDPTPKLELNILSGLKPTGKRVMLQVHHKLYFWNKLPWQYDRKHLQTLCYDCHMQVHKNSKILMYKDETMTLKATPQICKRCEGTGYFHQYSHIKHGVCFDCWGSGNYYTEEPNWV